MIHNTHLIISDELLIVLINLLATHQLGQGAVSDLILLVDIIHNTIDVNHLSCMMGTMSFTIEDPANLDLGSLNKML